MIPWELGARREGAGGRAKKEPGARRGCCTSVTRKRQHVNRHMSSNLLDIIRMEREGVANTGVRRSMLEVRREKIFEWLAGIIVRIDISLGDIEELNRQWRILTHNKSVLFFEQSHQSY